LFVNSPCPLDETCPRQVRFAECMHTRTPKWAILGVRAFDADGFRQNDKIGISA